MMEIARASGVPYPTASRLVHTLLHEGLIEREPSRRRYRPTALVQTLAHGFQGDGRLVKAARPHIVKLTREVSWPITLSTYVGHSMVIRDSTHALSALTFNEYFPGYASPVLESAAGLVYVANIAEAERTQLIEALQLLPNRSSQMIALIKDSPLLDEIRQHGYATRAFNRFTRNPGKTSSIAVAVHDKDKVVGAISLAYFAAAMKMEAAVKAFVEPLRRTALAIGADLAADTP